MVTNTLEEAAASNYQDSLALKMDAAGSSDTFVYIYQASRRNIQEDHNLRSCRSMGNFSLDIPRGTDDKHFFPRKVYLNTLFLAKGTALAT
jgi:hypothetical protein